MNQEIKDRLEQAAETAWEQDQQTNPSPVNPHAYVYGYKAGAQNILENPRYWGLKEANESWFEIVDELAKYREALERLLEENMCSHAGDELIEEALKTGGKQ